MASKQLSLNLVTKQKGHEGTSRMSWKEEKGKETKIGERVMRGGGVKVTPTPLTCEWNCRREKVLPSQASIASQSGLFLFLTSYQMLLSLAIMPAS